MKLNNFLSEVKNNKDFQLDKFLEGHGITLHKALLMRAELNNAWLNNAELNDAKLNDAFLDNAWLNNAELNDAELIYAELNDAKLNDAKLNNAWLNGAKLNNAWLDGAKLNNGTKFDEKTQLINIKCESIKFLEKNGSVTIIKNQKQIRQKFIELGAKNENISFAQAA